MHSSSHESDIETTVPPVHVRVQHVVASTRSSVNDDLGSKMVLPAWMTDDSSVSSAPGSRTPSSGYRTPVSPTAPHFTLNDSDSSVASSTVNKTIINDMCNLIAVVHSDPIYRNTNAVDSAFSELFAQLTTPSRHELDLITLAAETLVDMECISVHTLRCIRDRGYHDLYQRLQPWSRASFETSTPRSRLQCRSRPAIIMRNSNKICTNLLIDTSPHLDRDKRMQRRFNHTFMVRKMESCRQVRKALSVLKQTESTDQILDSHPDQLAANIAMALHLDILKGPLKDQCRDTLTGLRGQPVVVHTGSPCSGCRSITKLR